MSSSVDEFLTFDKREELLEQPRYAGLSQKAVLSVAGCTGSSLVRFTGLHCELAPCSRLGQFTNSV